MRVFCKKTLISKKTKGILYTNKKRYKADKPDNSWEQNIIYMWVLDNNNEWGFFTKKEFSEYFDQIDKVRNNIIDELLNR